MDCALLHSHPPVTPLGMRCCARTNSWSKTGELHRSYMWDFRPDTSDRHGAGHASNEDLFQDCERPITSVSGVWQSGPCDLWQDGNVWHEIVNSGLNVTEDRYKLTKRSRT